MRHSVVKDCEECWYFCFSRKFTWLGLGCEFQSVFCEQWFQYLLNFQSLASTLWIWPMCVPPNGQSGSWVMIFLLSFQIIGILFRIRPKHNQSWAQEFVNNFMGLCPQAPPSLPSSLYFCFVFWGSPFQYSIQKSKSISYSTCYLCYSSYVQNKVTRTGEKERGVCERENVQWHWWKKLNLPSGFWLLRISVAATTMGLFGGWGCSRMEQRKQIGVSILYLSIGSSIYRSWSQNY